jgi:hypothetical protein
MYPLISISMAIDLSQHCWYYYIDHHYWYTFHQLNLTLMTYSTQIWILNHFSWSLYWWSSLRWRGDWRAVGPEMESIALVPVLTWWRRLGWRLSCWGSFRNGNLFGRFYWSSIVMEYSIFFVLYPWVMEETYSLNSIPIQSHHFSSSFHKLVIPICSYPNKYHWCLK